MSSVLWRSEDGTSLERCVLEPTSEGWRLTGTVLIEAAGLPHEIRYSVQADPAWRTDPGRAAAR